MKPQIARALKSGAGILALVTACFFGFPGCRSPRDAGDRPQPAMRPLPFSQVRLEGEMGTRFAAATAHLLTWTDLYTLESFVASAAGRPGALWWDWPGDQIGRWLSVVHVAHGYGWTPQAWPPVVLADAVLPYQSPDGNFGPPRSHCLNGAYGWISPAISRG